MKNFKERVALAGLVIFLVLLANAALRPAAPAPVLPAGAQLAGMVTCGTSATCASPAQVVGATIVVGQATLSSGSVTVTGISPAFTSTSSFYCTGSDQTGANSVSVVPASASSITIAGTGSHVVSYACFGN